MEKILIASRNPSKLMEVQAILFGLPVELYSLGNFPEIPEVVENGKTFRDNALLKARAATAMTGMNALADDSGLEVDYLHGAPGVYSARYVGIEHDDEGNNDKLLKELAGVPEASRTARFRCVIAITTPSRENYFTEGVCEGRIATEPRGSRGFGYDPLFLVPSLDQTFAELGPEVKNKISHRAQAMRLARSLLVKLLGVESEGIVDEKGRDPE